MSSINFFFDNHMITKKKEIFIQNFNTDKVIVNLMKNSVLEL